MITGHLDLSEIHFFIRFWICASLTAMVTWLVIDLLLGKLTVLSFIFCSVGFIVLMCVGFMIASLIIFAGQLIFN